MNYGRSNCNIALKLVFVACSALSVSVSHAEYFGSPSGRTAKLSVQPQLTLEATYSTGDFATADYQQMGVRLNYQYSPKILMFGDLGQSEVGSESEISFGLGAYYSFDQSILGSDDSAVKVSLHQVNFERIPGAISSSDIVCSPYMLPIYGPTGLLISSPTYLDCSLESNGSAGPDSGGDIRNIAIELLISGAMSDSLFGEKANWYANGGIQMLDGFREDDTVLGIGAGVVLPLSDAEVYAGFDYADETSVGVGYRYFVR